MTKTTAPDGKNVGAHLDAPDSSVGLLLSRARGLGELQQTLSEWAAEPLARFLRIANLRDGVVVVHADSAAAFTQLRYRQQELVQVLQERLQDPVLTLQIRMVPAASHG